jgi:hypothetical protein
VRLYHSVKKFWICWQRLAMELIQKIILQPIWSFIKSNCPLISNRYVARFHLTSYYLYMKMVSNKFCTMYHLPLYRDIIIEENDFVLRIFIMQSKLHDFYGILCFYISSVPGCQLSLKVLCVIHFAILRICYGIWDNVWSRIT